MRVTGRCCSGQENRGRTGRPLYWEPNQKAFLTPRKGLVRSLGDGGSGGEKGRSAGRDHDVSERLRVTLS